jgi:hypothetical protein
MMTEVERLYQSFDGPIPKHRLEAARKMDEERERKEKETKDNESKGS